MLPVVLRVRSLILPCVFVSRDGGLAGFGTASLVGTKDSASHSTPLGWCQLLECFGLMGSHAWTWSV